MGRYVVAGVTGRVGAAVAAALIAGGARPTVLVRDPAREPAWAGRGAEVAVAALDDAGALARVLEGAAGFFTLLPESVASDDFHGARQRLADGIAWAVRRAGVPHVALLSAVAAALPDRSGPARDLHYLEACLRESGATLSALRACYFQDNVAGALEPATRSGVVPSFLPSADAPLPMIATGDVGRFAADALASPPDRSEIVDLLGPAYSIRQVAARLGAALGRTLRVVDVPPASHVTALMAAGVPLPLAEALAEMFAAVAAGLISPRGDRRLVGTTTIDETIAACVTRHRAAAGAPASPPGAGPGASPPVYQ